MEQRECAGYIITQSIKVKDSEYVLGEHPKKDMKRMWRQRRRTPNLQRASFAW